MGTIAAIIVEDEKNRQEALVALLEMYCPQVKVIGISDSIKSAYELITTLHPDLVFLDIILDQEISFDLLEMLNPVQFQIIFTTSSDGYALKAFKAHAVDYLMKPIDPEGLVKAVGKTKKLISADPTQNKYTALLQSINDQQIKRITIPTRNEGINVVEVENIIYVHGSGAYSTFHLADRPKIIASNNLGHYQSILPKALFNRAHQSYLANIRHIMRVLPSEGQIELLSGEKIPIARSRRDGLIDQLG